MEEKTKKWRKEKKRERKRLITLFHRHFYLWTSYWLLSCVSSSEAHFYKYLSVSHNGRFIPVFKESEDLFASLNVPHVKFLHMSSMSEHEQLRYKLIDLRLHDFKFYPLSLWGKQVNYYDFIRKWILIGRHGGVMLNIAASQLNISQFKSFLGFFCVDLHVLPVPERAFL